MNINDLEDKVKDDKVEIKEGISRVNKVSRFPLIIFEILLYVIIILLVTKFITSYFIQRNIVDGKSMENTLSDGDNLFVERLVIVLIS